jgi:hypothetical protein
MVAFQLAGKATRDALFLSTFDVAQLPRMVIAAAVLTALVTFLLSRLMVLRGPGRLVPQLFAGSALLLLLEWAVAGGRRPLLAVVFYLHFSVLGALLVSGFWAVVTERFDARAARATMGRITAGASLGGLLGGILPVQLGSSVSITLMLPVLALLHLVAAALVFAVRPTETRSGTEASPESTTLSSLLPIFRSSTHLRGLTLLVVLAAVAEGLLDWVFKSRATAAMASGEELLRFFAVFYTLTALLGIAIQTSLLQTALNRLGLARSAAVLPAGVSAGALGALFLPGLVSAVVARGTELVLRNSFFRSAYELLFTPVQAQEKRVTKLLIDVGAARLGDFTGAVLIQLTLFAWADQAPTLLLLSTLLVGGGALLVALRIHRGYPEALARKLSTPGDAGLPEASTQTSTLLLTAEGFDLRQMLRAAPVTREFRVARELPAPGPTRLEALEQTDTASVLSALRAGPLTADLVETAVRLLAWDAVARGAAEALTAVAPVHTGIILKHLLDPEEDFAVRRRLVVTLAKCPTPGAFEGLLRALDDRRFAVRYRAGRVLHRLKALNPDLSADTARIHAVVLREVTVGQALWQSRQLIDQPEDEESPMAAAQVRDRADRSLEHVLTLLALVQPQEPLRLAYQALHTDDRHLRATALEYLEAVLPDQIRKRLWPFLEPEARPAPSTTNPDAALENLLQSRESIILALGRARPPAPD